ncbi:MAG: hypothetical protein FJ295_17795 [Planctomycetes bacterium]|nr:hypothetical protein [Planctomycetota bacterium]
MRSSSITLEPVVDSEIDIDYRSLSKAAVFSLIIGVLSVVAFVGVGLLILPLLGLICGITAQRSIVRYPEEFTGKAAAWIGIGLSLICLIGAASSHTYVYNTEVPDGFERLPFYALHPDPDHPEEAVPADVMKFDGKKVFIKGYVHPSVKEQGAVKQFTLVGDMKECCFGGAPKVTDFVDVSIVSDDTIRYSWRMRKLAGVLRIDPTMARTDGLEGPCYRLEAEIVK